MRRIMLVDDDYGVLSSLRRCIHQMDLGSGHPREPAVVEIFELPQRALERAAECEFDLVIADWHMPGMDGLAFLTALLDLQPQIARLVMSADDRFRAETESIRRLRLFHFIHKPWNPQILRVLIGLALESRPPARQRFVPQRRPAALQFQQFAPEAPLQKPFAPIFRLRDLDGAPV